MFEPGARVRIGPDAGTVTDATHKSSGVALDNGRSVRIDPALLRAEEVITADQVGSVEAVFDEKALDRAPADKARRSRQTK